MVVGTSGHAAKRTFERSPEQVHRAGRLRGRRGVAGRV